MVKVDFDVELAAAAAGQCLACRIGGTHVMVPACADTISRYPMIACGVCGTMYSRSTLSGVYKDVGCPECFDIKRRQHDAA